MVTYNFSPSSKCSENSGGKVPLRAWSNKSSMRRACF